MYKFTQQDVEASYEEALRRINVGINTDVFRTSGELRDFKYAITEGIRSVFVMLSDDWRLSCHMCEEEEKRINFWEDNRGGY